MSRRTTNDSVDIASALEVIRSSAENGPPLAARIDFLQEARKSSPDASAALDEALVADVMKLRDALVEAGEHLLKAKQMIDRYSAMPLHPVTFLDYEDTAQGRLGLVSCHTGGVRAVALSEEAAELPLQCGDEVYLGSEQSVIVGPVGAPRLSGELAELDHIMPDDRLILKGRGEEQIIVSAARSLDVPSLRLGDTIRFDRPARLARERIENKSAHTQFALHELPNHPLSMVAAGDVNLPRLQNGLEVCLLDPDKAGDYDLEARGILLYGPSGNGKTLYSKVALSDVARRGGGKAYFVVVQASAFESPWVGETQRNIRECFESLRQAAESGPAVLFIDEIDAIGRIRGGSAGQHSDKFLDTLLTELDGFNQIRNVAVIAASNRRDLLDPALLSRMGMQMPIGRPGLRAAREILAVHLSDTLPYHPNGAYASATRTEIINVAVSKLYAPNSVGNELCTLKFADGRTRVVAANEMVSGRLLRHISQSAKQAAFHREKAKGMRGIQLTDIETAVDEALQQLATTLSPQNAHHHLDDLAHDEVVVSVVPHTSRVANRKRYLCASQGN